MKCRMILAAGRTLSLRRRCELLGIARSTFYAWCRRPDSRRAATNRRLTRQIHAIYAAMDRTYGSPRIHRELVARGVACGRNRTARLMHAAGLRAKRTPKFVVTTDSSHAFPIAPNVLDQQFTASAPNQIWMADITYVPTKAGWTYVAVVVDAHSRRVVGWALEDQLTTELPLGALQMAIRDRQPPRHLLHHSDRGTQYASTAYRQVLAQHGIRPSMSRRGNCWDNAMVESFFATLKVERVHDRTYLNLEDVRTDLTDYIERFYNRVRRHSALEYQSPVMYELMNAA